MPSVPVQLIIPISRLAKDKKGFHSLTLGINSLRPSLKLEAVKGWDRFGNREPIDELIIGKIKERELSIGYQRTASGFFIGGEINAVIPTFVEQTPAFSAIHNEVNATLGLQFKLGKFF